MIFICIQQGTILNTFWLALHPWWRNVTGINKYKMVEQWMCRWYIAPDKDWRQLGFYPPLFGLIGYFTFWIGYFNFLYWVSIWKQISNETAPCFSWLFCLLSVSLLESTLVITVYRRLLFPTYFENPKYLSIHPPLWY